MVAPVSVCIIFRDDPLLEQAVASIRPHVAEICILVDENAPSESLNRVMHMCRSEGVAWMRWELSDWRDDFSHSRNECMKLATQPWVSWCDSDDEVQGAEHLAREIDRIPLGGRLLCPYDYAHDPDTGEVTVQQWRERVVANDGTWHWEHPTHESLVKKDGHRHDPGLDVWAQGLRFVHRRTEKGARTRSLEILRKWHAAGHDDPWTHLNLGIELHAANQYAEAIPHFERHIATSGWKEERVLACLRAANCAQSLDLGGTKGGYERAQGFINQAREIEPDSFEVYYADACLAFMRAQIRGEAGAMREVLDLSRAALRCPETRTPVGRDPSLRSFRIHDMMRTAAEVEEDWETALEATERALLARPGSPPLVLAQKRYKAAKLVASFTVAKDEVPPTPRNDVRIVEPSGPMDVVFMCGPYGDHWNPEIVEKHGAGGSETAVVEMAKRLAGLGHRVRVYCNAGVEGTYAGVDYIQWTPELRPECDVLVAWRMAPLLPQAAAKVRLMWCHDVTAIGCDYGLSLLADRFLALSEWHKGNLVKSHGIPESQVVVTRNGIVAEDFRGKQPIREANKAIYCSSPDRGLGALLDMWPAIRARVPSAELDVYYAFSNWERQANASKNEHHRFLVSTLKRRMRALSTQGVTYHGMVPRRRLQQAMRSSGVWLYPTWFTETSCMTAMEARAAGLRIVTSPIAALPETVGEWGTMIEGDWVSDDYQARFVDAAVDALMSDSVGSTWSGPHRQEIAASALASLDWSGVATQWDALFKELLAASAWGALPAYREHQEAA